MDYSEFYPPEDKHDSYIDSMGHCSGCNIKAVQRQCKYCLSPTKFVCPYLENADVILDKCPKCQTYLEWIQNPAMMYDKRFQLGIVYTIRQELTCAVKAYLSSTMRNLHTELVNYIAYRSTKNSF